MNIFTLLPMEEGEDEGEDVLHPHPHLLLDVSLRFKLGKGRNYTHLKNQVYVEKFVR